MGKKLSKKSQKNRSKKTQRNMKKVKLTKKQKRRTNKHYKKRRTYRKRVGVKRGGSGAQKLTQEEMALQRAAAAARSAQAQSTLSKYPRKINKPPIRYALATASINTKILAILHLFSLSDKETTVSNNNDPLTRNNNKRIKFMKDILRYFNNAAKFQESIEAFMRNNDNEFVHLQATMKQILDRGMTNEAGAVTYRFPFRVIITDYYYVAYVSKMNVLNLSPLGKEYFISSAYNRFCGTFYDTILKYIDGETSSTDRENIINKLYGKTPEIFVEINQEMMRTSLSARSKSTPPESFTFDLSELDLEHNLIAKDHFYEILTGLINQVGSSLDEYEPTIISKFFKPIQEKMNGLFVYLNPIIKDFMDRQIDPILWTSAYGRIQRKINYYLSNMKLYAHQEMLRIYSEPEGDDSIVRSIGKNIHQKSKQLTENIQTSFERLANIPSESARAAAEKAVGSMEYSGLLYELHGLTGIIMLEAFTNSHKCVVDSVKLNEFRDFINQLEEQNKRVNEERRLHTMSQEDTSSSLYTSKLKRSSSFNHQKKLHLSRFGRSALMHIEPPLLPQEDTPLLSQEDTPLLQDIGRFEKEDISDKIRELEEAVDNNDILPKRKRNNGNINHSNGKSHKPSPP